MTLMRSCRRPSPKPSTSTWLGKGHSYGCRRCQSVPNRTPPSLEACATTIVEPHAEGGARATTTVGHARSLFMGSLSGAGMVAVESGGLHVFVHSVYQPTSDSDRSLPLVPASASPL